MPMWLIWFLLFAFPAYAQYELAICAIFQDEAAYLKEWIEFHKLVGVQHFYLYNHASRKQLSSKGESFIVRKRQHAGGLHHQLAYRQIGQASKGFDLHSSHCVVGYHS